MLKQFTGPPVLHDGRFHLMKQLFALLAILGLITTSVSSQKPGNERDLPPRGERDHDRGGPHRHGPPPHDPILMLFDTDRNGELSKKEMEEASTVLKNRDQDKNDVLTPEELPHPPRPRGEYPPQQRGNHPHHQRGDRPPSQREGRPPRHKREHPRDAHPRDARPNDARPGEPRPAKPRNSEGRQNPVRDQEPQAKINSNQPTGSVIFTGGYETDPRDHGRPVTLIAAALGVKPDVFRQAFSNVKPARGGDPTPAREQANKKVLMDALGKHGISNDRLDMVSNYYRYRPGRGKLWKHTPASAKAIIKEGKITGFEITNPGSGYMTPPSISIAGHAAMKVKATLEFSKNFQTNGSLKSLTIIN